MFNMSATKLGSEHQRKNEKIHRSRSVSEWMSCRGRCVSVGTTCVFCWLSDRRFPPQRDWLVLQPRYRYARDTESAPRFVKMFFVLDQVRHLAEKRTSTVSPPPMIVSPEHQGWPLTWTQNCRYNNFVVALFTAVANGARPTGERHNENPQSLRVG